MEFNPDQYYQSHQKLSFIGVDGQQQLQQASVLVIGAGGLGCPCLQYLAGCGIGTIGIADFDTVSVSNLHRQVLFTLQDVGKQKTATAKEKLSLYNPGINIQAYNILVDETNVLSLINEYDVIVDCTDNFQVRYLINDACVVSEKPLVYGAIHQTEGHVTVFNYQQSPTLRCLFPEEDNAAIQSCADIGAYNIITGVIGLMMANEVIKIILHHENILSSILYQFDVITGKSRQIKYQPSATARQQSAERFSRSSSSIEISAEELSQKINNNDPFLLIDVRETYERDLFNIGGVHIPLQQLLSQSSFEFSSSDAIVLYCQKGIRSLHAAHYLIDMGFTNVKNLSGGVDYYSQIK